VPTKPPKQPGADIPSDLKEPLFIETKTGLGLWGTKALSRAEIAKNVSGQIDKRFEAYLKHYGIPLNLADKFKVLCSLLLSEFGWLSFTTKQIKQPSAGAPRVWSIEGSSLIKRMDEIIRAKSLKPLAAAKELKKKYRADYGHLEAKSLSNRYSELKRQKGMSLASSPTEYRNAVGREIRILRAGIRKLRSDPRAGGKQNRDTQNKKRPRKAELETLIFWEKYYASILRRIQALEG
jgi:hypothetical protein